MMHQAGAPGPRLVLFLEQRGRPFKACQNAEIAPFASVHPCCLPTLVYFRRMDT